MIDSAKVARAICESTEADIFDELSERSIVRAAYVQQAEAAISAVLEQLRDPTEAMMSAGRPRMNTVLRSADSVWRAMLAAAAQGIETRRAETGTGSVHESPVA